MTMMYYSVSDTGCLIQDVWILKQKKKRKEIQVLASVLQNLKAWKAYNL